MLLVIPWWGYICPLSHNWSKFRYGPLGDTTYQISRIQNSGFRQEGFLYDYIMLVSVNSDLQDEAILTT